MLQAKVLQVANIRQLVGNFLESSPSDFLTNLETSSDRSREVPDTIRPSGADGSSQTGGPFLLRHGVGTLRTAEDSRFSAFFGCRLHQRFVVFIFFFKNDSTIRVDNRFVIFVIIQLLWMSWTR